MRAVIEAVHGYAPRSSPVLVLGETGTGKEEVVHALHVLSGRKGSLVAENVAAIPATLVESELFGSVPGAFTGAHRADGLFVAADGGTLFLDEIGDLDLAVQARLLRVLEQGRVRPVGSTKERAVSVRVVAATHHDLANRVEQGRFRRDLYFRLAFGVVELPALRDRLEDLEEILRVLCHGLGRDDAIFTEGALDAMRAWSWPGNVRELQGLVERTLVGRHHIRAGDLAWLGGRVPPRARAEDPFTTALGAASGNKSRAARSLGLSRSAFRRRIAQLAPASSPHPPDLGAVRCAVEACGGNKSAAARKLGVSRGRLLRVLRVIDRPAE